MRCTPVRYMPISFGAKRPLETYGFLVHRTIQQRLFIDWSTRYLASTKLTLAIGSVGQCESKATNPWPH
jgi:hypothetical protein